MAIAIAIITLPLRLAWGIIKHPKVLILLAIVIFAFIGIKACNNAFNQPTAAATTQPAKYQEIAPSKAQAPYVLATNTRVYYVSRYTDNQQVITLQEYFVYDKKGWKLQTQPLAIDRKYYGEVRLYERKD